MYRCKIVSHKFGGKVEVPLGMTMFFTMIRRFFFLRTYEVRSNRCATSLMGVMARLKSASEIALSSEAGRVMEYVLLLSRAIVTRDVSPVIIDMMFP